MTMKKFCLTLMLCLVAIAATRAQSFIITKSADTLRVYDVEIGYTSVYFKSSRDKEAPLERLSKTKIDHLILVDGQQFTFEGRTPVKEENKTYSVLLRGNRDLEKQEKEKKKLFWWKAPQYGFVIDYAWKNYKYSDELDDNRFCSGFNVQFQFPYVQAGVSYLHDGFNPNNSTELDGSNKLTTLYLGAHYRIWFGPLYFDPAGGYSYTHNHMTLTRGRKTLDHRVQDYNCVYLAPRVGIRFCKFMALSFAWSLHSASRVPVLCSAGLSFVPYKRQK